MPILTTVGKVLFGKHKDQTGLPTLERPAVLPVNLPDFVYGGDLPTQFSPGRNNGFSNTVLFAIEVTCVTLQGGVAFSFFRHAGYVWKEDKGN